MRRLQPGQEMFHSADPAQPAGMVVNAAADRRARLSPAGRGQARGARRRQLHLGSADGPLLQRLPLPYPLADVAHA